MKNYIALFESFEEGYDDFHQKPDTKSDLFYQNISKELIKLANNYTNEPVEIDQYANKYETATGIKDLQNDLITKIYDEFGEDIDYYEKNGFIKSLRTYLNLYKDKMGMAENNKQIKESEKSANRLLSLTYGMYAFISIVGIATILLLFSIQSILKQQKENK